MSSQFTPKHIINRARLVSNILAIAIQQNEQRVISHYKPILESFNNQKPQMVMPKKVTK